jgi:hypothetical protein
MSVHALLQRLSAIGLGYDLKGGDFDLGVAQ